MANALSALGCSVLVLWLLLPLSEAAAPAANNTAGLAPLQNLAHGLVNLTDVSLASVCGPSNGQTSACFPFKPACTSRTRPNTRPNKQCMHAQVSPAQTHSHCAQALYKAILAGDLSGDSLTTGLIECVPCMSSRSSWPAGLQIDDSVRSALV